MSLAKHNGTVWLLTNGEPSHFKLSETMCPCGCQRNEMQEEAIAHVEILRSAVGLPLVVTSGFRCPAHNQAVGGSPKSQHTEGLALDLTVKNVNYSMDKLASLALRAGFDGIGVNPHKAFVHVDRRGSKAHWLYHKDGSTKPIVVA